MKKSIIFIFFAFILIFGADAQKSNFAIHISNPLGMYHKAGLKLEYRTNRIGVLIMGAKYYGYFPRYPGEQGGGEIRLYAKNEDQKRYENFLYTTVLVGHLDYFAGSGEGFNYVRAVPESNYYALGAGWGRHYNYNRFFIDINAGLKFAVPDVKQEIAFYMTGPGSYIDLHINLGFQF